MHPAAGRGFNLAAGAYERGRPDYPEALQSWLSHTLGLQPGATALDLGAGTGKFTRVLRRTGARVIAVEPVAAMLAQLSRALPEALALAATAQRLPFSSGVAEAVTCAQAFHWFADAEALAEIHRVLKPRGRLGLVWNVRDETVPWVAAITELMRPYERGTPRFHSGAWRLVFRGQPFGDLAQSSFAYQHVGPPQTVIVDRVLSVSFIAALPPERQQALSAQLRELITTHPDLRGRDRIAFPYRTQAFCCSRMPG
ncbi:MAG TPA: class I SAM-dependent methyltransferase [Steroidobacteraceae bacterium]